MRWRGAMAVALLAAAGPMLVGAQGRGGLPGSGQVSQPDVERPQEPAVFRGGVTLVQIDAYVTDAQGNPVAGLTADDFEILERGQPRAVSTFAAVNIPIEAVAVGLPGAGAVEPDVQTNATPQGRTFLIALDEVSPERALRARNLVRRFIADHMGPYDVAAVAFTGRGLASSGQDFTSSRSLLLKAVDKFSGGFELSTPNVADTPATGDGAPGPGIDKAFSSDPRQLASSLRRLTEFLATLPGRKTLLYVGEGLGDVGDGTGAIDFFNVVDYNGGALTPAAVDAHAAIAAATRGNVTIYPVDPRGLTTDLTPAAAFTGNVGKSSILDNRADMVALADVTGGFAITNTSDFGPAFERVVRESSIYYTLGFNSEYDRRDGRFVRMEVRVKRPGLQVRSRNGYVAPLGEESKPARVEGARLPAVADALMSATSARGLPLRVFAAPYRADRDRSTIALVVEMDVTALDFVTTDGARTSAIEVSYVATESRGKVVPGRRHTATLSLPQEGTGATFRKRVRMLSQFELPDGRYQVRVSAGSASMAGSVVYDLDVPDFGKGPLTMSGIALTTASAAAMTTLRPHDPLGDVLSTPPTTSREFAIGEQVVLFAEVYDNREARRNDGPRTIELTASLLDRAWPRNPRHAPRAALVRGAPAQVGRPRVHGAASAGRGTGGVCHLARGAVRRGWSRGQPTHPDSGGMNRTFGSFESFSSPGRTKLRRTTVFSTV